MTSTRMSLPHVVEHWPTVQDFVAASKPDSPLSRLQIRTDIREAIALAIQHMNSLFDRDRDNEPFFYANHRADGTGEMHHAVHIGIPHVIGRCLLGCLIGEEVTGIPCPAEGLAIFTRYLRRSFDNEDYLNSYIDPARGNRRFVEFHNMREGLYGLVMLIRDRHSAWACETAAKMLQTLDALTDASGQLSIERAQKRGPAERWEGMSVPNAARMVDPLVEYHQLTGDPLALKLAERYARRGLEVMFEADGRFATDMNRSSGHIHSMTSALSGITRYALLIHDSAMLAACRRILEKGVPDYFSSWGWGDEVYPAHPAHVIGRGEINQTGDVIRTALELGMAGEAHYFELAERFLRSMMLPAQHREQELRGFLKDNGRPRSDAERDVLQRSVGGFGFPLPNDRMHEGDWPITTLDITSGAVHAMSECLRSVMTSDAEACRVNLLFASSNSDFVIQSRLPLEGRIEFTARSRKRLLIRIPEWVDRQTLTLHIGGRRKEVHGWNAYAVITDLLPGDTGMLSFAVPCKIEKETVDGTEYTTTWVGNQVISITPRGKVSPLPF